jgi:hypothetical protein
MSLPAICPLQLLVGFVVSLIGYFVTNKLPIKETQHLTMFHFKSKGHNIYLKKKKKEQTLLVKQENQPLVHLILLSGCPIQHRIFLQTPYISPDQLLKLALVIAADHDHLSLGVPLPEEKQLHSPKHPFAL